MSKNNVTRRGFAALGLGAAGVVAGPGILRAQPKVYRVGLIQPMTGAVAYSGQHCRAGALQAIKEINDAGGIKSMGGAKVETLLGDTQGRVELGVSEVEKMQQSGVDAFIGAYQSPVGIAASQAAAKYNTPFLIDSGVSDIIVNRGLTNVFRFSPGYGSFVDGGVEALDKINKAAGSPAKSIVIVHESGELGTGTAKLLEKKLPEIGLQVKEVISHDNPTRSFDNVALRIKASGADIVTHTCYRAEYVLLAQTLRRQKVNLMAQYSILAGGYDIKFVREMPDVAEYNMNFNHWYAPKSPKVAALRKAAEATGSDFVFEYYCAYNAARLLFDAVERAGTAERAAVITALQASTWSDHIMPYGPTKFVNGQNTGAAGAGQQVLQSEIKLVYPPDYAEAKAVFPRPKW